MTRIAMIEAKPAGANPNFPIGGIDGLRAAKRLNYSTTLVTAYRDSYEGVVDDVVDTWVECDTGSEQALFSALCNEPHEAIFSWVNPFVPIANRVALALGKARVANPGCPATLGDKAAVRERLDRKGIRNARWFVIRHPETGTTGRPSFPLVVKPVDGYSSRDVRLVHDSRELTQACMEHFRHSTWGKAMVKPSHRMLCEERLAGPLVSVEGIVVDGHLDIWGYSDRTLGPEPRFLELSVAFGAGALDPELPDYAAGVVEAIGYKTGPFHLEAILTEDGPVLVEFNPRLVGGGIHQAIDIATGGSITETVLCAYLGSERPLPPPNQAVCLYHILADKDGVVADVSGIENALRAPGVVAVICRARPGLRISRTFSNGDRFCYAIAVGETRGEARARAESAVSRIQISIDESRDMISTT